jgi:hypothetical protein
MQRAWEKCIQNVRWKTLKETDQSEDLDVAGKVLLEWN